jgi:probable phosphoglycerate mutase
MRAAIEEASEAVDGTVVVVSHGGAARRAVQALLGWSDEATDRISALGNCRWSELHHTTRGWRLHAHNVGPVAGAASATEPATTADVEPASDDDTLAAPGTR